ncbi:DUF2190 family protein [Oligosphaera ethanolica]|uniref:RecA/RadA family phage recombinase n=1 Tax=Oligosphaera ethanolica TaxID=760260 RepID=A0AAE3VHZ3_9BACT|nr:DUF2190 family protein [Oligosphaera ethanolica]MDQ0291022.1 putative RecA/RadA family phage recombinase [Oligosphaera ethanolica]
MDAIYYQQGNSLDYTPTSAVGAGDVIALQNNYWGVAKLDIAANALGCLAVAGVFKVGKPAGAIAFGALLYWNALTKQAQTTPIDNAYIGRAAAAAGDDDADVLLALNASNIGTVSAPEAQAEPAPSAADVTPTVGNAPTATNAADVTVTGTYADDDDALEAAINANRADVAAILTWAGAAKTDIGALATNLNKINDDIAAIVAKLKTAGIFE